MSDLLAVASRFEELALQAADPDKPELTEDEWAELDRLQQTMLDRMHEIIRS